MVSSSFSSQTPFDGAISSQVSQAIALLHQQIPHSAVVTDWLATHTDQLIVRATVQVGTTPLASAMAMASTIEEAEDLAKVRAIASALTPYLTQPSELNQTLAVHHHPPHAEQRGTPQSDSSETLQVHSQSSPELMSSPARPSSPMADRPAVSTANSRSSAQSPHPEDDAADNEGLHAMDAPDTPLPMSSLEIEEALDSQEQSIDRNSNADDSAHGELSSPPAKQPKKKHTRKKTASTSPSPQQSPPSSQEATSESPSPSSQTDSSSRPLSIDLSDIIAKTSVELKRLGWTDSQGREHLQRTYGKRSRQHLTDPELLDFLTYLESLES